MVKQLAFVAVLCVAGACATDSVSDGPSTTPTSTTPTSTTAPITAPPATEPSATEPPTTMAPPTDPPPTEPAATGPPATEPASVERPDPCSLWTAADLQAVTGLAFAEGVYNDSLSVNGQDICDWLTTGGAFGNAQVLVLAPGLDHAFLREGTNTAFGPVTDLTIPGADAAHISVDGRILGVGVGPLTLQLAYLPPGADDTSAQLIALAEIAVANLTPG